MKGKVCFSFDVEEWFMVEKLRSVFPTETWNHQKSRVVESTERILDLLEEKGIKATFFMLGCVAKESSDLVREISNRGHEVASHGYSHQMTNGLSKEEIRRNIVRSKNFLEAITGTQVLGYRAPSFSINEDLLDVLKEAGFLYDSSLHDFKTHDRYGSIKSDGNGRPFRHVSGIIEIPVSVCKFGRFKVPIGGGGYFRLMPGQFYRRLVEKQMRDTNIFAFYLHPWEIDEGQPRVKIQPKIYEFRHYVNIRKTFEKLENLIKFLRKSVFEFCTYRQIAENIG